MATLQPSKGERRPVTEARSGPPHDRRSLTPRYALWCESSLPARLLVAADVAPGRKRAVEAAAHNWRAAVSRARFQALPLPSPRAASAQTCSAVPAHQLGG